MALRERVSYPTAVAGVRARSGTDRCQRGGTDAPAPPGSRRFHWRDTWHRPCPRSTASQEDDW